MNKYLKSVLEKAWNTISGYIWLFVVCGIVWLIYSGIEGLYSNAELKKISLEELSKKSVGRSRYLEITGCYTDGLYVVQYYENTGKISGVIFPVLTLEEFIKSMDESTATTKLIVIRNSENFSSDCYEKNSCLDDILDFSEEGFTIKGLTVWGFDNSEVSDETRKLIQSINYNIQSDIVILREDAQPETKGKVFPALMLIGGILLLVFGIVFYIKVTKNK